MPTLIELVSEEQLNYEKIEDFLITSNLPPNPVNKLTIQWELKNSEQQDVFQVALRRNQSKLFKLLLDFDLPVPEIYEKNNLDPKIIELLDSRGTWQRIIQTGESGILLNRIIKYLELGAKEINSQPGEAILVMGQTGDGKSTLTNYMNGVDYQKLENSNKIIKLNENVEEIAKVGKTTSSQTLFPANYHLACLIPTEIWVDMPGTDDTAGSIRETTAAIGTSLLTQKLGKIKGILLICEWGKLEEPRLIMYRDIAAKIGRIIDKSEALIKHVVLVVTKPKLNLTTQDVQQRLHELWKNELEYLQENIKFDDYAYQEQIAIKRTTKIFIDNIKKIIISDVTQPYTRQTITETIKILPEAISESKFNFTNYHNLVERFKSKLTYLVTQYHVIDTAIEQLTAGILLKVVEFQKLKITCNQYSEAIKTWKNKKERLQKGNDIEERIYKNLEKISELENNLSKTYAMETLVNEQIQDCNNLIAKAKNRERVIQQASINNDELESSVQIVSERNEMLVNSYNSMLNMYIKLLKNITIKNQIMQKQLHILENNKLTLQEEKIEVAKIREEAGDSIDEHIAREDLFYKNAQQELNQLNSIQQFNEKLLERNKCVDNVNVDFFCGLYKLIKTLNWANEPEFQKFTNKILLRISKIAEIDKPATSFSHIAIPTLL